jgi:hypothetical protein
MLTKRELDYNDVGLSPDGMYNRCGHDLGSIGFYKFTMQSLLGQSIDMVAGWMPLGV